MNDIKDQARTILQGDTQLIDMLHENNNPYNKDQPASKQESIVDYLNADEMIAPFITLRADQEVLVGRTHLTHAFLLVRCYNERDKTFYTINELVSRVKQLINGQRFTIEGYSTVETVWETTSSELPDDGVGLNYRELQFRIALT